MDKLLSGKAHKEDYAPINVMPHYPPPGLCRGKGGHLTCFDTKTCPICGEFDCLPYACATIKNTNGQIPHLSLIFEWGEGWDLTDWHAR